MKPVYKLTAMSWFVDGLGMFNTKEEALKAIEDTKLRHSILIRISDKTKRQLQQLAESRQATMSEVIRTLIEQEVNGNG